MILISANIEFTQSVKLIAFDLDGTLLNHEHRVSERNRKALLKLKQNGFKMLVTTGRTLSETKEVCKGLPFDGYVCSNGMMNYDESYSVVHKESIPSHAALQILHQLRSKKINYELHDENGDIYLIEEDLGFLMKRIEQVKIWPEQELIVAIQQGKISIVKFLILTLHNRIVIKDHVISSHLPVSLIEMSPFNVEFNKIGISKWSGLQYQLQRFSISGENVLAFGDSMNDIEILKKSGWSVAMGNAADTVKKAAKDTTLCHWEDGVAAYLEKMLRTYMKGRAQ